MKSMIRTMMIVGFVVSAGFSQLNFDIHPLVQMDGYNSNFKISNSEPWNEAAVYLCWENTIDSSQFNIYRMVVEPYLGVPELMASSDNPLRSPDVNPAGDMAWEEVVGGISNIKYYVSAADSLATLVHDGVSATDPQLSRGFMVYVQGDALKLLNFQSGVHHTLDQGGVSNPDLSNETYSPYVSVVYEKSEGDAHFIRTSISTDDGSNQSVTDLGQEYLCANPSYGTSYLLSYQAMIDSSWSIATQWDAMTQPYNATHPYIVSTGIITMREVNDYMILFENDSIPGDREIYGTEYSSTYTNISNSPGNDYNPQAFYTNLWDTVAVIWEHEVENGREIWWAKDTLRLPVSTDPRDHAGPETFRVGQAYPNPFNGSVGIKYALESSGIIQISIFDLNGRPILTLDENKTAGDFSFRWDGLNAMGEGCETGVYFVNFSQGRQTETRKMVLLK